MKRVFWGALYRAECVLVSLFLALAGLGAYTHPIACGVAATVVYLTSKQWERRAF